MKKIVLFLFITSISVSIIGQDYLIKPLKQNYLWIGLTNPIFVMVENEECGSFFLTTDNGTIINSTRQFAKYKCQSSVYYVRPSEIGRAIIYINKVINGDTTKIGKQIFRVKGVLPLIGRVGNKTSGDFKKSTLVVQMGLLVDIDHEFFPFYFDIRFKTLHFSALILRGEKCVFVGSFEGPLFTDNFKIALKSLKTDDKVIFYGIQAKGPNGIKREVKPIEFLIYE